MNGLARVIDTSAFWWCVIVAFPMWMWLFMLRSIWKHNEETLRLLEEKQARFDASIAPHFFNGAYLPPLDGPATTVVDFRRRGMRRDPH